jgi:hypothetical protein
VNAIQTVQAMLDRLLGAASNAGMFPDEWPEIAAGQRLLAQLQAGGAARPQTWDRDDIEAVISCLGDDAAQLRDENPEDERADNMDRAASMLTVFAMREYAAAPAVAQMLTEDEIYLRWTDAGGSRPHKSPREFAERFADVIQRAFASKNGLTLPEGGA